MLADSMIGLALLSLLLLSLELGFRRGVRAARERDPDAGSQVGAVQGALLGLLGLLLAFSFAAAGARFLERQDLIVQEANAIGTAFLRADLLPEPERTELREALRSYTEHRIRLSARLRDGIPAGAPAEVEELQARIWRAASRGVAPRRDTALAVLNPVNEVIDLHATRIAAARRHLPAPVLALLIVCSGLSLGVIGYGCGLGGDRRAPLSVPLALIVTAALWITIDLDHPRGGLLQINDAPLQELKFDAPRE
jgi:hypothetical protein